MLNFGPSGLLSPYTLGHQDSDSIYFGPSGLWFHIHVLWTIRTLTPYNMGHQDSDSIYTGPSGLHILQPPTSPSPWRYGVNFNCIKLISFANDCLCQAWFHLVEHCVKEDYTVKKFMTINEHQVILKSHLACYWPKPIKKQQFQIIANFSLEILNLWSRE